MLGILRLFASGRSQTIIPLPRGQEQPERPTQKVRRGFIADRYAPLIAALYDGTKEADISTEVTFEDGRKGVIAARVKIRDMTLNPVSNQAGLLEAAE